MKSQNDRFEDYVDQILRWYKSEGTKPLQPALQGRLQRWKAAREYILTNRPLTDTITVKFLADLFSVSEPQAWRDVRDTKRFFASMETVNKEFEKIMLVAQVKDLRTKAMSVGDLKTAAKCDETLMKLRQFDQPDESVEGTQKTIVISLDFNPARIGAKPIAGLEQTVAQFIGERAKRELMIDDTDFEVIPDDNGLK